MPVDIVGASLASASLAISLLDGLVKGYIFFLNVGNAATELGEFYTLVEKEKQRLLNFAEASGLLNYLDGPDLPESLHSQRLVLVAVFNQIQIKLDTLASLTKYKPVSEQANQSNDDHDDFAIKAASSSVQMKWAAGAKKREHARGINHVIKYYNIGKEVVRNPRYLQWTALDKEKFGTILQALSEYNDYLQELLMGEYARRLEKIAVESHLEIILLRNDIQGLARLAQQSLILSASHERIEHSSNSSAFETLANIKLRSVLSERPQNQNPPAYREKVQVKALAYKAIEFTDKVKIVHTGQRVRTAAKFRPGDQNEPTEEVWVEWKLYDIEFDAKDNRITAPSSIERVQALVSLLQASRVDALRVPECLGYFDFRDDVQDNDKRSSKNPELFGIVYRKPLGIKANPVTLRYLLSQKTPSLTARTQLAYQIARSILYFNSVCWFHKSLRSDAVIYCQDGPESSFDYSQPMITGFEFARPDEPVTKSTEIFDAAVNNLYVHPIYQQISGTGKFSRVFDIYSLGIVLLELAYWEPIEQIIRNLLDKSKGIVNSNIAKDLRGHLLMEEGFAQNTILEHVKSVMGDKYHSAIHACIQGLINLNEEKETEPAVSLKLHSAFVEQVVDMLGSVQV